MSLPHAGAPSSAVSLEHAPVSACLQTFDVQAEDASVIEEILRDSFTAQNTNVRRGFAPSSGKRTPGIYNTTCKANIVGTDSYYDNNSSLHNIPILDPGETVNLILLGAYNLPPQVAGEYDFNGLMSIASYKRAGTTAKWAPEGKAGSSFTSTVLSGNLITADVDLSSGIFANTRYEYATNKYVKFAEVRFTAPFQHSGKNGGYAFVFTGNVGGGPFYQTKLVFEVLDTRGVTIDNQEFTDNDLNNSGGLTVPFTANAIPGQRFHRYRAVKTNTEVSDSGSTTANKSFTFSGATQVPQTINSSFNYSIDTRLRPLYGGVPIAFQNDYAPWISTNTTFNVKKVSSSGVPDEKPNAFTFTNLTGQEINTFITTSIQIRGLDSAAVSIASTNSTSFQIQVTTDGSASASNWVSNSLTIQNEQYLHLRLRTSSSYNTEVQGTIKIGTETQKTWRVTTETNPNNVQDPISGEEVEEGTYGLVVRSNNGAVQVDSNSTGSLFQIVRSGEGNRVTFNNNAELYSSLLIYKPASIGNVNVAVTPRLDITNKQYKFFSSFRGSNLINVKWMVVRPASSINLSSSSDEYGLRITNKLDEVVIDSSSTIGSVEVLNYVSDRKLQSVEYFSGANVEYIWLSANGASLESFQYITGGPWVDLPPNAFAGGTSIWKPSEGRVVAAPETIFSWTGNEPTNTNPPTGVFFSNIDIDTAPVAPISIPGLDSAYFEGVFDSLQDLKIEFWNYN